MESIENIFLNLNDKQVETVKTTEGYVRVVAGAGSGKTRALTSRYAYIVEGLGINPSNILCVTFTNKAAQEMRKRVRGLIGEEKDTGYITTYHGFCVQVLREDINKIQYPRNFIIMDEEDKKLLLRDVYNELEISSKDYLFKQSIKYISSNKNSLEYLDKIADTANNLTRKSNHNNVHNQIYWSYIKKQKKNFALDFDDLINFTFYIFTKNNEILYKWQKRLHYILVDETQDSNDRQFSLVEMLSSIHKNLFVVGDPDQTIYEWRGANPNIFVEFNKRYPSCKTIIMDQNYRSTPDILAVGNSIITNNKIRVEKDLFTKKNPGLKVIHFHGKSEQEEGGWIAKKIQSLVSSKNCSYQDIAILYRASYVSRYIEQALIKDNITYTIYGGIRFFERKEIKDALAYLRLLANGDDLSFLRIINEPRRGLGKKFIQSLVKRSEKENLSLHDTIKKCLKESEFNRPGAETFINFIELSNKKKQTLSVSDLLQFVLDESGIIKQLREDGDEDRLDNIKELISSIILYEKEAGEEITLTDYLQEIALYTNLDVKEEKDRIKLMTIHQSKGLEFKHVFLSGMSEGIIPSFRSLKERKGRALEEERRLTYVAITRAMKGLYLTESEGFNYNTNNKYPSRFIFEIKEQLLVEEGEMNNELIEESKKYIENQNITIDTEVYYDEGSFVLHPVFGRGKIVSVNNETQEYTIKFENLEEEKPISMEFKHLKEIDEMGIENDILNKEKDKNEKDQEINELKEPSLKTKNNIWSWIKQRSK